MSVTAVEPFRRRCRRRPVPKLALAIVLGAAALPAAAQSLNCGGALVEPGDAERVLVRRCGNPLRVEPVCVQRPAVRGWLADAAGQPTQPIVALECTPAEDWTYDRGPGNFLAIVRMRDAVVESIRDGERPR